MVILIPPSEGKARIKKPIEKRFGETDYFLMKEVKHVIRLLSLIGDEELRSIYGTSLEKARIYHRQNQDALNSRIWFAIERYTGVVYEHINWLEMSDHAKEFMEKYVLIFSGLFGMVTPKTLIPDYKLKMNVLALQHHWNPILTDLLAEEDMVIDLLPQVHRKAYTAGPNVTAIEFSVITKGKRTAAGHYGKAVKGEFIRYIAENNITSVDDFGGFSYDGFEWDGTMFIKLNS
ncbi:MAG: YaaA family protein [Candidatus Marinimicrobia bacterium]|nr:YaaA family protein [Candidatus Neomarinimicrobiota bacterium]